MSRKIISEGWLSPREFSTSTGYDLSHVYRLVWQAKLEAERRDGRWFIAGSEVERVLTERRSRELQDA